MQHFSPPAFCNEAGAHAYLLYLCAKSHSISNIAYLAIDLPGNDLVDPVIISTYNADWVRHYLDEKYALIDPAIIEGMQGFLPFNWSERRDNSQRIRQFFGEATEFGVNGNGLSFPIRGPHGDKAVFSINSELPDAEWRDYRHEHQAEINLFAYFFHMQILEMKSQTSTKVIHLTPREREVLYWAAAGKTAWETSTILSISQKSVEFYVSNLMAKLKATTKPQAIAHALRLGLLN